MITLFTLFPENEEEERTAQLSTIAGFSPGPGRPTTFQGRVRRPLIQWMTRGEPEFEFLSVYNLVNEWSLATYLSMYG